MKTFYRVCNPETKQGLWYNSNGEFTGLIHNKFKFCKNRELKMEFDKELIGFLSATKTIEDLYLWFSKDDIIKLQDEGWFIHEYQVEDFKFYDKFQHWIINEKTSSIVRKLELKQIVKYELIY